jgi:uncharacterized protein (TIGR02147 family)
MIDYRQTLKNELKLRVRANPRYSLRAFARDLGLSPASLSEVLSGKKGLSRKRAEMIVEKLDLNAGARSDFLLAVNISDGRTREVRQEALRVFHERSTQNHLPELEIDALRIMGNWRTFALLEYLKLARVSHEERSIARNLNISTIEVRDTLQRLLRLEMIEEIEGTSPTRYRVLLDHYATPTGIPSETIKQLHEEIMEKAKVALRTQNLESREFSSLMIGIPRSKVPELKSALRAAILKINHEFENEEPKDCVYSVNLQTFEITTHQGEEI